MGSTFRMQRGAYRFDITFGPEPTYAVSYHAATQLHQIGHWCIAQHFQLVSDGTADIEDVG